MEKEAVVTARGLTKSYGKGSSKVSALQGAALDLFRGEYVALVGKSGSGKSTLLHCLAGLEKADSGSILVAGQDLLTLSEDALSAVRLERIGIVFQFFNFLPSLSIGQNIALPAQLKGVSHSKAQARARELLAELQIQALFDRYPSEVSGGELQRASLARALINEPFLVLADEPTGNLDSASAENVLRIFQRVVKRANAALLLVTHDMEVAAQADRTLEIIDGVVQEQGRR